MLISKNASQPPGNKMCGIFIPYQFISLGGTRANDSFYCRKEVTSWKVAIWIRPQAKRGTLSTKEKAQTKHCTSLTGWKYNNTSVILRISRRIFLYFNLCCNIGMYLTALLVLIQERISVLVTQSSEAKAMGTGCRSERMKNLSALLFIVQCVCSVY